MTEALDVSLAELVANSKDKPTVDKLNDIEQFCRTTCAGIANGAIYEYIREDVAPAMGLSAHATKDIVRAVKKHREDKGKATPDATADTKANMWHELTPDPHITPEAKAEALDIFTHGDPMAYIKADVAKNHVSDEPLIEGCILSIVTTSISNSSGIHTTGNGISGKGKSSGMSEVAERAPEGKVRISSMSAKAAFYNDMPAGTILFADDIDVSDEMEATIKRSTSRYQIPTYHETVDQGATGKREGVKKVIPPRTTFWGNSVDSQGTDQLQNRIVTYDVDVSGKTDISVFDQQAKKATGEYPNSSTLTHEVLVCRAILEDVCKNLTDVVIPYADKFIPLDVSNRRNVPLFFDVVKAFAKLNYKQRNINDKGEIEANLTDFMNAEAHIKHILKGLTTKLNAQERELLRLISDNNGLLQQELVHKSGMSSTRVTQLLNGRNGKSGLLSKVPTLQQESITESDGDEHSRINKHSKRLTVNVEVAESYINGKSGLLTFKPEYMKIYEKRKREVLNSGSHGVNTELTQDSQGETIAVDSINIKEEVCIDEKINTKRSGANAVPAYSIDDNKNNILSLSPNSVKMAADSVNPCELHVNSVLTNVNLPTDSNKEQKEITFAEIKKEIIEPCISGGCHRITELIKDIKKEYGDMSDEPMKQTTAEKIAKEIKSKFISRCKYGADVCYQGRAPIPATIDSRE